MQKVWSAGCVSWKGFKIGVYVTRGLLTFEVGSHFFLRFMISAFVRSAVALSFLRIQVPIRSITTLHPMRCFHTRLMFSCNPVNPFGCVGSRTLRQSWVQIQQRPAKHGCFDNPC